MEGDIVGAGRGQSQADCVCHNSLDFIFEVTRTNSKWVIPTWLVWVIGLIFGSVNKMWIREGWSLWQNLSMRCLIIKVGVARGSLICLPGAQA